MIEGNVDYIKHNMEKNNNHNSLSSNAMRLTQLSNEYEDDGGLIGIFGIFLL